MNTEIIAHFSKQSDAFQQKVVLEYFDSLKNNPHGWKLCAETLLTDAIKDESAIFFCFQVIEDYIKSRYVLDDEENRKALNHLILSLFEKDLFVSSFIQNKYAHLVNSIFLADFPNQKWNSFFNDFLSRCDGVVKCDIFLRILIQINLDIADREIPRTTKDMQRNTLIKDLMRETCLVDLAQFWFNIINTYRETSPPTVCLCLEVIRAYVSWIDINLITNDSIMTNLFTLFTNNMFRLAVADCFNAILRKGMDPIAKTQIIENFMNIEYIKKTIFDIFTSPTNSSNELEFVAKISYLINTMGIELIDSFKKLKCRSTGNQTSTINGHTNNDFQVLSMISNAIEAKFSLMCQFLSHKDLNVCQKMHSFVRDYIQWIKNNLKENPNLYNMQTVEEKIVMLLSIIINKNKYPSSTSTNMEDEFFDEFRKSSKVIFDNLLLLNISTVINFVCEKIVAPTLLNWKSNSLSFSEIEVALYYFYLIGENMNMIDDVKRIENLIQTLVTSSISSFPNPITQSFYFDLIFRYEKFFNSNLSFLSSQVLISFLDERGLRNSNIRIRSKVCKLFNKFVKSNAKSKSNVDKQQPFTEDILKRLQDFLKLDIAFDNVDYLIEHNLEQLANSNYLIKESDIDFPYAISITDQLFIYETIIFLIITNQNYDVTRKHELIQTIFQGIWENFNKFYQEIVSLTSVINQNGYMDPVNKNQLLEKRLICAFHLFHTINLVSATSKSFSNVNTMKSIGVQDIYMHSYEMFKKAMSLNLDSESQHLFQSAIRLFLHRLVVCLNEAEIIPLLPSAIRTLFFSTNEITSKSLQELVPLFSQIVPKYKHSWLFQRDLVPFIEQINSFLILSFFKTIFSTTIEAEKLNLQKSYYIFLHLLVTSDLIDSFFDLETQVIEQVLGSLIEGSVNFPDCQTQRTCYQIITKLIEIYGNDITNLEKHNRLNNNLFVQFIYKSLILACFVGASKNVDDMGTTYEAFACLRKLNTLLGDELYTFLRMQIFPKHFPSISNIDEFLQLIFLADLKSSKKSIKQALSQFQLQQDSNN
ncbi:hypothetical protein RDWZM_005228 [Blomia tropicalis]|uniref:Exportin-T n=1 Tax=Blomia tropicalis TaxID=40697 RepID=A0A9Q0RNA2_BLOTA|nr:hypothetical protein RDWZM_005228 [Blomia tropicalis]